MLLAYLDASDWLTYVCLGGILFCWTIEIIAAFRNKAVTLGFLSFILTPIAGLVIGCIYSRDWKIGQVMVIFVGFVIGLFIALLYAMYSAAARVV